MTPVPTPDKVPVCSVCIANYNGLKLIDACLQSVLQQQFTGAIEIIVHDDASTDGSAEYIRTNYPSVILIASKDNAGFCVSNNRMVEAASGEYILLLNNDAELFDNAIAQLHTHAQALNRPAILGLPQYDLPTGDLVDVGNTFDLFFNPIPNFDRTLSGVGMVIGACLWIPRTLWNDIGGFPAWFGSIAEDVYICTVARLRGHPVQALPMSGFRHWGGQSFGGGRILENKLSTKLSRRTISERNKTFVMIMTCPAPLVYILVPVHLSLLLIEGLVLSLVKRRWRLFADVYWNCLTAQWIERKRLASMRKRIQEDRKITLSNYLQVFSLLPHKLRLLFKYGVPEVK